MIVVCVSQWYTVLIREAREGFGLLYKPCWLIAVAQRAYIESFTTVVLFRISRTRKIYVCSFVWVESKNRAVCLQHIYPPLLSPSFTSLTTNVGPKSSMLIKTITMYTTLKRKISGYTFHIVLLIHTHHFNAVFVQLTARCAMWHIKKNKKNK